MKRYFSFVALSFLVINSAFALNDWNDQNREVGWFFTEAKPTPKHKLVIKKVVYKQNKPMQKMHKVNCNSSKEWIAECGFIDPGKIKGNLNTRFKFEQNEMTQLMRGAAMSPNNMNKVYQFQKFNWWAVNQAMNMSYTWQYNMAQHPNIDPNVKNPSSEFASLMVSKLNSQAESDFYKMLSKSAYLIYFSRSDCKYCHLEAPLVKDFSEETGLKIVNASLDNGHISIFKNYLTAKQTITPGRILKVGTVPTLFLYLKPNMTGKIHASQFIRVATGVVTEDVIKQRIIDFVRAYHHAIVSGVIDAHDKKSSSKKYVPNFGSDGMNKLATDHSYLNPNYKNYVIKNTLSSGRV